MYSDLTIPFGAVWPLAAIAATVGATVDNRRRWIAAALLFGLASLVRFQSFGFLLGTVLGIAFLPGTWRSRIRTAALVLVVGIFPTIAWKVFLVSRELGARELEFHSDDRGREFVSYRCVRTARRAEPWVGRADHSQSWSSTPAWKRFGSRERRQMLIIVWLDRD
jgi:hypothetical protein